MVTSGGDEGSASFRRAPYIPHSRPLVSESNMHAVLSVMRSGWVGARGPVGDRLASELAAVVGHPSGVCVSSGTAALELAIRAITPVGERVAVPAYACVSVERAARRAGAVPHLIDVEPETLSYPTSTLSEEGGQCAAVVLVHQFGLPALATMASQSLEVPVIEDVTTALGGVIRGAPIGSFGRLAVTSMSATKLLCAGEGGAVLGQPADISWITAWIDPESQLPEDFPVPNAKLSDLAAALGRSQLDELPDFIHRRAAIANHYNTCLARYELSPKVPPPETIGTWWRYLVEVSDYAEDAVRLAQAEGVAFARPVLRRRWIGTDAFPISERLVKSIISVPVYPALSDGEVERVGDTLARVAGAYRSVIG